MYKFNILSKKQYIDYLTYVAGVLAPLFTLPQAISIYVNQSAKDVSLLTWISYSIFAVIWLLYGIIHREFQIIILYTGLLIVNISIVIGILIF